MIEGGHTSLADRRGHEHRHQYVDVTVPCDERGYFVVLNGDDGREIGRLGPYSTAPEAKRAYDVVIDGLRKLGGTVRH